MPRPAPSLRETFTLTLLALGAACATPATQAPPPAAPAMVEATASQPAADAAPAPPARNLPEDPRENLVVVFQQFFHVPKELYLSPEMRDPQTIEDAQAIVRSDNMLLFDKADRIFRDHLAQHPDDLVNLTWHAQLLMVWVDSAQLTAQTLEKSVERLSEQRDVLQELQASPDLPKDGRVDLRRSVAELDWLIATAEMGRSYLNDLAQQKLEEARAKTELVLSKSHDTYEGYRLAADLYRITGEREKFDAAVAKIEALNPNSNGLRFLKGIWALKQDKDLVLAEQLLRQAVDKDPKFTKARYYLALTYLMRGQVEQADAAMLETLRSSPAHPFAHALKAYIHQIEKLELPF